MTTEEFEEKFIYWNTSNEELIKIKESFGKIIELINSSDDNTTSEALRVLLESALQSGRGEGWDNYAGEGI